MPMKNHRNNRQKVTGPLADYYLHPRKGYKRKRPQERLESRIGEAKLEWFKARKNKQVPAQ